MLTRAADGVLVHESGFLQSNAVVVQDHAYLHALLDSREPNDARLGSSAKPGWEWVQAAHDGQVERLAQRR